MRTADPGETLLLTCAGFDTGLSGIIEVSILDSLSSVVVGPIAATIEAPAGSAIYLIDVVVPSDEGDYTISWDDGSVIAPATEDLTIAADSDPVNLEQPGTFTTAGFDAGITGLVGTVGLQLLRHTGAVARSRSTANITETSPGVYQAQYNAPATDGNYVLIWDIGSIAPGNVAADDLVVQTVASTPGGGGSFPGLAGMMGRTCTIISRTAGTLEDDYGNVESEVTTSTVACEIQQVRRVEPGDAGEFSISEWMGFFPSGTALDTGDAVSEATMGTFEVTGRPWDANSGSSAVNHVEATLKIA